MEKSHRTVLTAAEMDQALDRAVEEILRNRTNPEALAVVGIRTRGVHLARRIQEKLLKKTGLTIPGGEVDINLYRDDWTRISHHPKIQATRIPFSLDDREVVLVDDVLFTGRTVRAAMEALMDFGRPDRILLLVMVDRGHRELPIQADFIGKFVATRPDERVNVYVREMDEEDGVVVE